MFYQAAGKVAFFCARLLLHIILANGIAKKKKAGHDARPGSIFML